MIEKQSHAHTPSGARVHPGAAPGRPGAPAALAEGAAAVAPQERVPGLAREDVAPGREYVETSRTAAGPDEAADAEYRAVLSCFFRRTEEPTRQH